MTLLVPDAGQISQVMAQSPGPAFILGAVADFTSILLGRITTVLTTYAAQTKSPPTIPLGSPQV